MGPKQIVIRLLSLMIRVANPFPFSHTYVAASNGFRVSSFPRILLTKVETLHRRLRKLPTILRVNQADEGEMGFHNVRSTHILAFSSHSLIEIG
jgi:hypothetical protein